MANIQRLKKAPVVINLDKQRTLRYTLGSLAYLEEEYGTIDTAVTAAEEGSIKAVIKILFAGLRHEDKEITEADVADMVDIEDVAYVSECIGKAMAQDQPAVATEGKAVAPAVKA